MDQNQVELTIKNVLPLAAIKIETTIKENNEVRDENLIFFLDQVNGQVFDIEGRIDEQFEGAILQWIQKKNEEVKRRMSSQLMTATPEQLRSVGIDVNASDLMQPSERKVPKIIT
jgi:hypothetical protein